MALDLNALRRKRKPTKVVTKEVAKEVAKEEVPKEVPKEVAPSPLAGQSPAIEEPLPVDSSQQQQQERFLANLERLDSLIEDKEVLGSVLERMMLELSEHPDYRKFMSDDHLESLMRAMMETFAVVKASKMKKAPATRTRKSKLKVSSELQQELDSIGMTEDGTLDLTALGDLTL